MWLRHHSGIDLTNLTRSIWEPLCLRRVRKAGSNEGLETVGERAGDAREDSGGARATHRAGHASIMRIVVRTLDL